jgi:hypothetical protein
VAANTITLNVSLHALNAISAALNHSVQTFQNALAEVNMEVKAWQDGEMSAAKALQEARDKALAGHDQKEPNG